MEFSETARRLGIVSGLAIVILQIAYSITLVMGFLSLPTPAHPIGDPLFTILELLILLMLPALVSLMVAVHAWAPPHAKALSLAALVFMSILAGISGSVHFAVLTLSRHQQFAEIPGFLSFRWPSLVYALDILAWDFFFPLAMLFAAPVFRGTPLANAIRLLMFASGALAFAGLSGVAAGNMQLRNIGILGYVGLFLLVAALLTLLFHRSPARQATSSQPPHADAPSRL